MYAVLCSALQIGGARGRSSSHSLFSRRADFIVFSHSVRLCPLQVNTTSSSIKTFRMKMTMTLMECRYTTPSHSCYVNQTQGTLQVN